MNDLICDIFDGWLINCSTDRQEPLITDPDGPVGAIPEPSAILLFGVACVLILIWDRRRRKHL